MRVAAPPFRRGNRHLAAADDQRVKGHVVAEKHCIEPAVPCADGVAQTAVHLLEAVRFFHLQLGLHRSDKAKHRITLSRRLFDSRISAKQAIIFHSVFMTILTFSRYQFILPNFRAYDKGEHGKLAKIHKKFREFMRPDGSFPFAGPRTFPLTARKPRSFSRFPHNFCLLRALRAIPHN